MFVYVGAYTEPPLGRANGISLFRFDSEAGVLAGGQTEYPAANPSYLTLDESGQHLYAVNELDDGQVTAFDRDAQSGTLTARNRQPSHGSAPCYVSIDSSGRYLLVANYAGGTIAALPITPDGQLDSASSVVKHEGASINPDRQEAPHPHMIAPTPDGRFVLVTDLGTDQILLYRLGLDTGRLDLGTAVDAPPGAGPRHFSFGARGRCLYVINELASTLMVYSYDGDRGALQPLQTVSTLPSDFEGVSTAAHVAVSPDGRFVYGSNRGSDTLAIWAVDEERGEITLVGHEPTRGKTPRGFAIDPTGRWLLAANQESDSIVVFRRDSVSGRLTWTGQVSDTPSPVAIVFG